MEECHGHLTSQPSKSLALEHSDFQPSGLDTSRVGSLLPDLDIGSLVRFLGSCYSKAWLAPGGFSPASVWCHVSPGRSEADSVLGRSGHPVPHSGLPSLLLILPSALPSVTFTLCLLTGQMGAPGRPRVAAWGQVPEI